jgi:hypothetical protein
VLGGRWILKMKKRKRYGRSRIQRQGTEMAMSTQAEGRQHGRHASREGNVPLPSESIPDYELSQHTEPPISDEDIR